MSKNNKGLEQSRIRARAQRDQAVARARMSLKSIGPNRRREILLALDSGRAGIAQLAEEEFNLIRILVIIALGFMED